MLAVDTADLEALNSLKPPSRDITTLLHLIDNGHLLALQLVLLVLAGLLVPSAAKRLQGVSTGFTARPVAMQCRARVIECKQPLSVGVQAG